MRKTQRNAKIHPRRKPKMQSSRTDGEPSSTQPSKQDSGQPEDAKTATPREKDSGQPGPSTRGAVAGCVIRGNSNIHPKAQPKDAHVRKPSNGQPESRRRKRQSGTRGATRSG